MELFYVPEVSGNTVRLDASESRHLIKVLRFSAGDEVFFTDGKGSLYCSRIQEADPHACRLELTSTKFFESSRPRLHIGIAPTKNIDRIEWLLEKATEIGVHSVIPVICEHSERKTLKRDRLEKVMIAAMKQSGRYWLPELSELVPFAQVLQHFSGTQRFIANAGGADSLQQKLKSGKDTFVLIGPEGDFSSEELKQAVEAGFDCVNLGTSRLRTETAALLAVSAFSILQ